MRPRAALKGAYIYQSRRIHLPMMRPSPAPLAQEYVNPELDSSVIGGHAAPSKDFLPTDIQTSKNLPLYTTNRYLSYGVTLGTIKK